MKPQLQFTPVDTAGWPRAQLLCYFSKTAPTGYSLTAPVDVTRWRSVVRRAGLHFFPAYLWLVTRTLCEQPEFCTAEVGGQVGFYNVLTPLYAAFHEDDHTFSLQWTEYDDDFPAFHRAYLADKARWGSQHGALGRTGELPPPNAYTVSCLPWLSFSHFSVHSYEKQPYFLPSVESGRFYRQGGRTLMPLSLTCHHAATDGWHVARFWESLQAAADRFEQFLPAAAELGA